MNKNNQHKDTISNKKLAVALLGATGPVGQKVITLLENHPLFELVEIAASESSDGQIYGDRVQWKNEVALPSRVASMRLLSLLDVKSKYVISALPTDIALTVEPELANRGHIVCSNASAFRMDNRVPLLIPEVNSAHLAMLDSQPWAGKILTNPNCSTVFLAGALAPLQVLGEIDHVNVVTMQALSGAGYPGVSAFDLMGNIIPHIGGEEDKIRLETKKILGVGNNHAKFGITVHVNRVPVLHGHTVAVHVRFKNPVTADQVLQVFKKSESEFENFIKVHMEQDRPQPLRDLTPHDMRIHVGRVKQGDDPHVVGFISLGHNLVRGAAGAAIAILESYLKNKV